MLIRWLRFNLYLFVSLGLTACFFSGCSTEAGARKRALSTVRLHLELPREPGKSTEQVPIYREHPVMINIEKEPFLTEGMIKSARVVDVMGGFELSLQFDRQGTWLLEQYTTANRGRRFAVYCQWMTPPDHKLNAGRWLAAPKLGSRITDGEFTFTPDSTRDEADLIATGLNHVAKNSGAADRW